MVMFASFKNCVVLCRSRRVPKSFVVTGVSCGQRAFLCWIRTSHSCSMWSVVIGAFPHLWQRSVGTRWILLKWAFMRLWPKDDYLILSAQFIIRIWFAVIFVSGHPPVFWASLDMGFNFLICHSSISLLQSTSFFGQTISYLIPWNATVGRDPL